MNQFTSKLFAVLFLAGCATERAAAPATPNEAPPPVAAAPAAPEEPVPALRLPADVKPTRYALNLTIDPDAKGFSGTVDIDVILAAPRQVLWLHGLDLTVTQSTVQAGGQSLQARYAQANDDGVVKLTLPRAIGPGPAVLHFAWTGAFDPKQVGLYLAHESGLNYAYTQFEDIYARRAFPGFDEPGFKTPFEVTLVVPKGAVAVANTQPTAEEPADATHTRIRYATTKPLPTYLLAWAVGAFDVVEGPTLPPNALRSWPVPVRGIAPKGRGGDLAYALKAGSQMLLQQEQYFGIAFPYPKLDQVAVPDYAYGAMENAGEIHYREDLLLFKEGVSSEQTRTEVADTIAHEQAHQWFGDLVTFGWWEEAWLNESFATWFGHRTAQQWNPALNAAIGLQKSVSAAMANDALVTARAIRQPLRSVKDIADQFDGLTYQKGGGVLGMFERYIGAEKFRQGVSTYLAAHAHGTGSTDDLLASFSKAAGVELTPAFHTFLDQAGVPLVKAKVSCGAAPSVFLEQSRYFPVGSSGTQDRTWQIPVCVRYAVAGKEREQCTLLTKPSDTLALAGCPDWLIPNAAGAGYYRWSLSGEDLKKLRTAGYRRLAVTERIALAQNLRSAVASGALPIAEALLALEPIALDADGEVALEAFAGRRSEGGSGLLGFARDRLLPAEDRAKVDAYSIKRFAPVLARVGFAPKKGEDTATGRLRVALLGMLARAQEPKVVKELTRLGRAYAGTEAFRPEVVDPDLAGLALGVAVEHGDDAFMDLLLARLAKTDDAELRERILVALGEAKDAKRSARALAVTLDPALRKQEGLIEISAQAADPLTREASWGFLKEHYDTIVGKIPKTYAGYLPFVASAFCDAAHADDAQAFFGPRADKVDGMAKNVRQVTEGVRLCAAQAEAQRESAQAFFSGKPAKVKQAPAR